MHYFCEINMASMNNYFLSLVLCFLTIFFSSCGSRQQRDNHPTDSTTVGTTAPTFEPVPITERLSDLGLTSDSDWRGINLGDDFATVKATEKGKAFESDATHIGYTIEFKNLETSDILYYQTNQKVSAIDVDLFLNSGQSVHDYQQDLTPYFTARYGASKSGNGGTTWTGSQGEKIILKDVSKGKDFGLKIKIGPATSVSTASSFGKINYCSL